MAGKSGKVVTLQVQVPGSSPPSFVVVGGARNHSMVLNPGLVDDSDKDSGGWSSVGPYGLKTCEITQTGVYKGTQGELILVNNAAAMSGSGTPTPLTFRAIEEGVGTWEGAGYVDRNVDAPHDNILSQTFTVKNQGSWAFTAESPQS